MVKMKFILKLKILKTDWLSYRPRLYSVRNLYAVDCNQKLNGKNEVYSKVENIENKLIDLQAKIFSPEFICGALQSETEW